MQQDVLIFTLL